MTEAARRPDQRLVPMSDALRLTATAGGMVGALYPEYSNALISVAPERGGPLGGLMAGLAVEAARRQLALESPLQSLTVQFLAAARFAPVTFEARRLRGGRGTAFVDVTGVQGARKVIAAHALFAADGAGPSFAPSSRLPPAPETLPHFASDDPQFPWFHHQFDYRFDGVSRFASGELPAFETVWMRAPEGVSLDEPRLCTLLDAIYPAYTTSLSAPVPISVTTMLNYEFLGALTPDACPDGWTFVEFQSRHFGGGWAVEDAIARTRDGRPIALARQRRKLLP